MNVLISVILGAIVGYVCYLIALAVPFLVPFATIVGLVAFLLVAFGGYAGWWTFPRRS